MLKAVFCLIAFMAYSGAWSVSAEVKNIQKKCEGQDCYEMAQTYYNAYKFNEAFIYSSTACLGKTSEHSNNSCAMVFELAMDKNRLDKATTIFKQRCKLKDINSVEDCVYLAILEQKKGNKIEADNFFKEVCSNPKSCHIAVGTLLRSLSNPFQDDCDIFGEIAKRTCDFQKIDPTACQKHQDYLRTNLKCVPPDTSCWDSTAETLFNACEVQQGASISCEALIRHKKLHGDDHKEFVRGCALDGTGPWCKHLARYFELNDPQAAKIHKCGFGVFEGCGKIK
jgi:hypothetical protein